MTTLAVAEVFESIQGEGHFSGRYCTFVRFWGCNARAEGLACAKWCDTQYAWDPSLLLFEPPQRMDSKELFDLLRRGRHPIVFTGGEPLLQLLNCWGEVVELADDLPVCIETNGTLDIPRTPIWVTCSPKPPEYLIRLSQVDELKVIVDSVQATRPEELLALTRRFEELPWDTVKFLQPLDNDLETARLIAQSLEFLPGWRLGLQLHKILKVR